MTDKEFMTVIDDLALLRARIEDNAKGLETIRTYLKNLLETERLQQFRSLLAKVRAGDIAWARDAAFLLRDTDTGYAELATELETAIAAFDRQSVRRIKS